ncbi:MAG: GMC family oxidoreductase [Ferruginibacter sp.]
MSNISQELTLQEVRLRTLLRFFFFFYIGAMLLYLLPAITFIPGFLKPYPFINDGAFANNSTIKMGLFAALCLIGAADVRRYLVAVEAILVVMGLAVVSGLLLTFFAQNNYVMETGFGKLSIRRMVLMSTIFDTLVNILFIAFYIQAQKARYKLLYFSPLQFRTLTALAEVVIEGDGEILKPIDIAHNVDRYMSSFKGKTKFITKLALTGIELYPLIFLKPPTSYMRSDARKAFLMRHFYQNVSLKLAPPFIRMLVQAAIRLGKQLCFMGYYNDERVFDSVGYKPFSKRADTPDRMAKFPLRPRKHLAVLKEIDINTDELTADVVIVGSGPGASVLAKGLIEKGRTVLMIERGDYTDPSQFNEDEIDMVSKLYADGALQLASDFQFQVIQGSCVGGSSVVNNAVCFDTPNNVLDRWNDLNGLNAGLDLDRYKLSNQKINQQIGIRKMTDQDFLNPGGNKFLEGCANMGLINTSNIASAVSANIAGTTESGGIDGCVGCGYCNMGCAFGKKLSMLDTVLPEIQLKHGPEALKIIAGCEVTNLNSKGGRINSLTARFENGRKIKVKANTFVVSAGAVSSSILLQRSGIAVGKAGKNLSFNIGSPMNALFPEKINAYEGLQISHYLQMKPDRGYIFETWFNPPMFQSTVMPGWWDDHFKNMHRYNRFACTGVLVGSESNAEVRIAGLTKREIRYTPTKKDFDTLLDGLVLAGDIYLNAGAELVMPNTFSYYEFKNSIELKRLKDLVKDNSDITLGTGHPQGGNVMSATKSKGVIDPEFKVYGYENLFVCDASVFPSSLGVNPQVSVMTMADYAVPFIAASR